MLYHFSHSFLWLSLINMSSYSCCSTIFYASVKLNFFSMIFCKWLHFKCYWESEDSILCKLYSDANIHFLHVSWGASSFYLKHHFAVSIVFNFTWNILFWIILREWWFHVCAPCTSIQIAFFVHKPWGASSYYSECPFGLIIISLFNLFFGSFDCSLL
jgi:hypothetical protein